MKTAFNLFEPHFTKHHNKKNVEIEMRLGRISGNKFDTNIGKESFNKAIKSLEKFKKWDVVEVNEYDAYYGQNGLRTTRYEDDTQESIIKKRVANIDYNSRDLPFDIRLGISTEDTHQPCDDTEYDCVKHKKRTSYTRKGLRIDCTIVTGDPDDMDAEETEEYQIEFEIINVKTVKNRNDFYNHIYKIKNLCDCLV